MGDMSSDWRCSQFRCCIGIQVRVYHLQCRLLRLMLANSRKNQIYRKGYVFRRGTLVIQMFQQEQVRKFQPGVLHPRS